MSFKNAEHWKKLPEKKVKCLLCPHECFLDNGEVGKCKARMNILWKLKSLNYGKIYETSYKKIESSLYHFFPGKEGLNIIVPGENLFVKNYGGIEFEENMPLVNMNPGKIIEQAMKTNSKILIYSGEPTIYFEYSKDIIGKKSEMKNVLSTKGFISERAMREFAKIFDAAVFEVYSMREGFYEVICKGKLEPILKAIKIFHDSGRWTEIKMPLVSELHKDFYDVRKLVSWILNNLSEDVPLHFSAFSPESEKIVKKARKIALDAGMNYVYTGNVLWNEGRTTFCPNCKKPVVIRGENKIENYLKNEKCVCGKEIPGIWH